MFLLLTPLAINDPRFILLCPVSPNQVWMSPLPTILCGKSWCREQEQVLLLLCLRTVMSTSCCLITSKSNLSWGQSIRTSLPDSQYKQVNQSIRVTQITPPLIFKEFFSFSHPHKANFKNFGIFRLCRYTFKLENIFNPTYSCPNIVLLHTWTLLSWLKIPGKNLFVILWRPNRIIMLILKAGFHLTS